MLMYSLSNKYFKFNHAAKIHIIPEAAKEIGKMCFFTHYHFSEVFIKLKHIIDCCSNICFKSVDYYFHWGLRKTKTRINRSQRCILHDSLRLFTFHFHNVLKSETKVIFLFHPTLRCIGGLRLLQSYLCICFDRNCRN